MLGKNAIDRINQRYGSLVVVERAENTRDNKAAWVCKCDCGNTIVVPASQLARGQKHSCGCLYGGKPLIYRRTHKNKLYNQWSGMIYRCTHEAASHYERYGERGVSVCQEWIDSFEAFADWSIANGYKETLEIDRIDNNGNYSQENCRWVSHMENSRNRNTRKTSKSGVSGVIFRKDINKWRVTICANYKRINIGNYDTFEDAVSARKKAEEEYWGNP